MNNSDTPIEDYTKKYGLFVKREDLSCPLPGPPFSKTRGVFAHLQKRKEKVIGVLDTYHSQAGWAVARACQILGKKCINFYPEFKYEPGPRNPQLQAKSLGAKLVGLKAGMSAVLYHQAKKKLLEYGKDCYMMPNALKLDESVSETAKEVPKAYYDLIIIPASSGTIAAGVIAGFLLQTIPTIPTTPFVVHLGYSRSHDELENYIDDKVRNLIGHDKSLKGLNLSFIDEGYNYKDTASKGPTPPWACNQYYDLKAFRWWMRDRKEYEDFDRVLFWNIG